MSSKIKLKKYSIFEFQLLIGGETINVVYKKDEEEPSKSSIEITDGNGEKQIIYIDLITSLYDALNEIDPYGFVFSDLDSEEK